MVVKNIDRRKKEKKPGDTGTPRQFHNPRHQFAKSAGKDFGDGAVVPLE
jgi:hypothetical protein